MSRLILIRHGESIANREQRFTRVDHEPLTAEGEAQASATGARLRDRFAPVALYASPFKRALDTARLIGAALGLEPVVLAAFHEQNFGQLKGQPYGSFYGRRPPEPMERWRVRPPGGETLEEVALRVGPIFDELAERHVGEEAVVVSHGGVMAALRAHVAGRFDRPPESTHNAGGYLVEGRSPHYDGPFRLFESD